jgi:PAS domain S-box-containing protein
MGQALFLALLHRLYDRCTPGQDNPSPSCGASLSKRQLHLFLDNSSAKVLTSCMPSIRTLLLDAKFYRRLRTVVIFIWIITGSAASASYISGLVIQSGQSPIPSSLIMITAALFLLASVCFLAIALSDAFHLDVIIDTIKTITGSDPLLFGHVDERFSHSIKKMIHHAAFTDILMHTIPSAVVVTDGKGRIILANKTTRIMFCPGNELIGGNLSEILANAYRDMTLDSILETALHKGRYSVYWEGMCVDTKMPVFLQFQKIELETQFFLLAVITDISETKNAADEIFFRTSLLDNVFDSIVAHRRDGSLVYANRAACILHQYSVEDIISLKSHDLIFPASLSAYMRQMNALTEREPANFELMHRRKNGTFIPVETHCSIVVLNGEELIIETHHDLSTIKKGQNALRESEERFHSFFDNAKDGVFIATSNGFLLNINIAGRSILGIGNAEPDEIDLFSLFNNRDDKERLINDLAHLGFVKDFTCELRKIDGAVITAEINATYFHNPYYHITGYHGFIRDITHERMMEQQIRQSQKLDAIGRLAGGIAHDFNNILTIIIGNAEIALVSMTSENPLCESIREIKESAERAAKLTTQLLTFSRKQIVQPEIINVDTLILDLHKMLIRLIGEDIDLDLLLNGQSCPVRVDRNQFEQIILNLVVNARDAIIENDRSEKKITIETFQTSAETSVPGTSTGLSIPHLTIRISDTGIGIPEEHIDKIFDPFFTTKGPDKGTGLGLSTVIGIISQNNARIHVVSKVGEFTRFEIFWPCSDEIYIIETGPVVVGTLPSGNETILIVEDEASLRVFTANALARSGYTCLSAADYQEAVSLIEKHPEIDLAFIDIIIPGKDGMALAGEIKKILPNAGILLTSGYPESRMESFTDSSKWDVMRKPYNIAELGRRVRDALDGRNNQRM